MVNLNGGIEMDRLYIDWDKLRNGEEVKCPDCKKGIIVTEYNPKTSKSFHCTECKFMINID